MDRLKQSKWFRGIAALLLMAFGLSPSLLSGQPEGDEAAAMTGPATPSSCPVTEPNGKQPPTSENVFGRGPGGHGNDQLWTNLWTWGRGSGPGATDARPVRWLAWRHEMAVVAGYSGQADH
jgi:hypothetical protein